MAKSNTTDPRVSFFLRLLLPLSLLFTAVLYAHVSPDVQPDVLERWSLQGSLAGVLSRPWTLLTYAWVNTSASFLIPSLLLLTLLALPFSIALRSVEYLLLFLLGGLFGGLLYLFISLFSTSSDTLTDSLSGCSAGVAALLVASVSVYLGRGVASRFSLHTQVLALLLVALSVALLDYLLLASSVDVYGFYAHVGGYVVGALFGVQRVVRHENSRKLASRLYLERLERIRTQSRNSGYDSLTNEEKQLLYEGGRANGNETTKQQSRHE